MPNFVIQNRSVVKDILIPICNTTTKPVVLKNKEIICRVENLNYTDNVNVFAAAEDYRAERDNLLEEVAKRINPELTTQEKKAIMEVCAQYKDMFSKDGKIGKIKEFSHRINLPARPVKRSPCRKPSDLQEFEKKKVKELLSKDIIEPSCSSWAKGTVVVEKGHIGEKVLKLNRGFVWIIGH